MKKLNLIFLAAIIMAVPVMTRAQSSYRQALEEFWGTSPQYAMMPELLGKQFKPAVIEMNKKLLKNPDEAESVSEKYAKEQLMDDVFDVIFIPPFKNNLTEEELREMTKVLKTPEGQRYKKHETESQTQMSIQLIGSLMSALMIDPEATKKGELKLDPITPNKNCPEEYIEVFDRYFEASGIDYSNLFDQVINAYKATMKSDKDEAKLLIDNLKEYLKDNFRNLYLNASYETMTVEDLEFSIKIQNTPAYSHLMKGVTDMITQMSSKEKMEGITQTWGMKYITWLTQQGVQMNMDMLE